MSEKYIIGLDQSTQGTKAILTDSAGRIAGRAFLPHRQIISEQGWVSHDGEEIYSNCIRVTELLLESSGVSPEAVVAIGITNQRETTIAWDRDSGKPVEHAIVWQCARAREVTAEISDPDFESYVRSQTGIPLSPYFPAAKAAWLLRHNEKAAQLAECGRLCIGTIDSWLVFKLTGGRVFKTDWSNASRTQLLNLHTLCWDEKICGALGIPLKALPGVENSDGDFGSTDLNGIFPAPVPIRAVLGDSHAALFGQACVRPGMTKVTYGTGSSIMMNVGHNYVESRSGLVTSLAWGRSGQVEYVLEGNINYAGAVISWLQKDLGLFQSAVDTQSMAEAANREDCCYLVPAFSGLGAPYWRDDARAVITGMSRTTGKNEIVKAGLECIAYQVTDILRAMSADSGMELAELRVDGGPSSNRYLMQFQSDMAQVRICVPAAEELSAVGAATMAGIGAGLYSEPAPDTGDFVRVYAPAMDAQLREKKYSGWKAAVEKAN